MQAITTIGLDIAKSVFQVHGIDADGQVMGVPLVNDKKWCCNTYTSRKFLRCGAERRR